MPRFFPRSRKMSRRKKLRSPRRRLQRRLKRRQLANRTSVPVGLGFPKRMVMTHKYCEFVEVTSTLGVIQKKQISCNGMYQPDAGGHKPMYFNQMIALYDHYTVIGSKVKITAIPKAANEDAVFVGIYKDDDSTTSNITGISVLNENTSGTVRLLAPNANNPVRFSKKWSAKKTFGGSILGNDNLQGNASGNPTEQTFYTLAVQTATAADATVIFNIEVTYIAVWDELKELASSS